jgi:hypothetical protein
MRLLVSGSTRTVRDLAGRWPDHLGHLITPRSWNSIPSILRTGLPWAVDNGAYSGFDRERFVKLLERCVGKPRLLWVVCPDVVADAKATLALWPWWSVLCRSKGLPVAFVLQDGQEDHDLPDADCYFIGGSTRWKLSQASADLCAEVKCVGKYLHCGRVNSLRRLEAMLDRGCDSVDGSSMSMFGDKYIHRFALWIERVNQQPPLPFA